jgi:hypothetical protein
MKLCALNRQELDSLFASVGSLNASSLSNNFSSLSLSKHAPNPPAAAAAATATDALPNTATTASALRGATRLSIDELATVLAALRKLREAITASNRCDKFARRAYFFAIHVAVLCKDWQSYVPALHALLESIHARNPLPAHDVKEYVGLLILDQACRQADPAGARETKLRFAYRDRRVECVLRSLVDDNWVLFWQMKRAVDGYQRSVVEFAEGRMRVHALKCLGKGYMSADRAFVERCAERAWEDLVSDGVGWELREGDKVVIRKPKGT